MPRASRNARLARLAAPTGPADPGATRERRAQRALLAVCGAISDGLARAGVDPASAAALRHRDEAAARLAALGNTPELRRADAEVAVSDNGAADGFAVKIADMAKRYSEGYRPDVANASLAELFAWCLTQPAPEPASSAAGKSADAGAAPDRSPPPLETGGEEQRRA